MKKIIIPFLCTVLSAVPATAQNAGAMPVRTETAKSQVTPREVIDNYIKALGGREKLQSVKTAIIYNTVSAGVLPNNITMVTKKMGNKFRSEQMVMGKKFIQLFNGETGYFDQDGVKTSLPAEKIPELKKSTVIDALAYDPANYSSVTETDINGKAYYVLTSSKGKFYFDKTTGLLFKTSTTDMGDAMIILYMTVNGIKFPQEIETNVGGTKMTLKTTKVIINADVSEADFQ